MSEQQPPSRFCRTPEDFEEVAAAWLRFWGYRDAKKTESGPDGGVDVVASGAIAQVKAWMTPIGIAEIQQLKGVAHDGRLAIFFSLTNYTASARRFAQEAEVALFRFAGYDGSIEPSNEHARNLLRQAAVTNCQKLKRTDDPLRDAVHEALLKMSEVGGALIISCKSNARYVQFSSDEGSEIYGETVDDDFLPPDDHLTREQLERIQSIGWENPTGCRENFHKDWHGPNAVSDAVTTAVNTLIQVHGVDGLDAISIESVEW